MEAQHDTGGVRGEEVGAGRHAGVLSLGAHREGGTGGRGAQAVVGAQVDVIGAATQETLQKNSSSSVFHRTFHTINILVVTLWCVGVSLQA